MLTIRDYIEGFLYATVATFFIAGASGAIVFAWLYIAYLVSA